VSRFGLRAVEYLGVGIFVLVAVLITASAIFPLDHTEYRRSPGLPPITKRSTSAQIARHFSLNGDSVHGMDYSNSGRVPGMVCYEYVSAAFRPRTVATYCYEQGPPRTTMGRPTIP
jgi:hypothetical protein